MGSPDSSKQDASAASSSMVSKAVPTGVGGDDVEDDDGGMGLPSGGDEFMVRKYMYLCFSS